MNAKDHYDNLLAGIYSWMIGDFEKKVQQETTLLTTLGILPSKHREMAIDLGSGNGVHSVALARLGFDVTAVDFSATLLKELDERKGTLSITTVQSDILAFMRTNDKAKIITCMGDTITHLQSAGHVDELIRMAADQLPSRGRLILSFRDLSIPLENERRFIPVRSDPDRIMTCFLEYFPDHVIVHDIVHERSGEQWNLRVSAYPKLRLTSSLLIAALEKGGFTTTTKVSAGMTVICGERI